MRSSIQRLRGSASSTDVSLNCVHRELYSRGTCLDKKGESAGSGYDTTNSSGTLSESTALTDPGLFRLQMTTQGNKHQGPEEGQVRAPCSRQKRRGQPSVTRVRSCRPFTNEADHKPSQLQSSCERGNLAWGLPPDLLRLQSAFPFRLTGKKAAEPEVSRYPRGRLILSKADSGTSI
jgi:hypothetical protein